MAIVLGAFILHGLEPGPLLLRDHLGVVVVLALGIALSQLIGSFMVLFAAPFLVRLVSLRATYISPVVLALCLAGAYSVRLNVYDVFLACGCGFFGFFLRRYRFPIIPIAIGFMLGNLVEKAFHQSLMMAYGSYKVFYSSVLSVILISSSLGLLIIPYVKSKWLTKK